MKERLEKIIKRVILPKYPFIVDYEVMKDSHYLEDFEVMRALRSNYQYYYRVNFFIDLDMTPDGTLRDVPFDEIKKDVEHLFMVLGPNDNENLEGTEFYRTKK
jgi:hypothetical protein